MMWPALRSPWLSVCFLRSACVDWRSFYCVLSNFTAGIS